MIETPDHDALDAIAREELKAKPPTIRRLAGENEKLRIERKRLKDEADELRDEISEMP